MDGSLCRLRLSGARRSFAASVPEPAPLPPQACRRKRRSSKPNSKSLNSSGSRRARTTSIPTASTKSRERLDEIEDERGADVWTPEQLAMAGAVVTIGDDGKARNQRGLVRPEDMPKEARRAKPKAAQSGPGDDEAEEDQSPAAVRRAGGKPHGAQVSGACRRTCSSGPISRLPPWFMLSRPASCWTVLAEDRSLQIAAAPQSLHRVEGSKAFSRWKRPARNGAANFPPMRKPSGRGALSRSRKRLLELLAFCAAATINAVQGKSDRPDGERLQHADRLCRRR